MIHSYDVYHIHFTLLLDCWLITLEQCLMFEHLRCMHTKFIVSHINCLLRAGLWRVWLLNLKMNANYLCLVNYRSQKIMWEKSTTWGWCPSPFFVIFFPFVRIVFLYSLRISQGEQFVKLKLLWQTKLIIFIVNSHPATQHVAWRDARNATQDLT